MSPSVVNARPPWQSATNFLIAINVVVFLLMVLKEPSSLEHPTNELLLRWGADFGPLTLDHDFWRVLTAGFLHIGIIHIAVNMWSLWVLGRMAERFVGPTSLVAIYLLTGIGASMASLAWDPIRVSAGASGPIFGFVGAMIGILYFAKSRLDPVARKKLLGYVVKIAVINLFIGLSAGIDNMAHLGGLVTGMALGSLLFFTSRAEVHDRAAARRNVFIAAFAVLALLFVPLRAAKQSVVHEYQGSAAFDRQDLNTAIAEFKRAIEENPNSAVDHEALGDAFAAAKRYPEALAEYQRSLALEPDQPEVQVSIASIYGLQGRTKEAFELFSANIDKVKAAPDVLVNYAALLLEKSDAKSAEAYFRKAINLDPNLAKAHTGLAMALDAQGEAEEASKERKIADDIAKKASSDQR